MARWTAEDEAERDADYQAFLAEEAAGDAEFAANPEYLSDEDYAASQDDGLDHFPSFDQHGYLDSEWQR